jgi:hypothetical protein
MAKKNKPNAHHTQEVTIDLGAQNEPIHISVLEDGSISIARKSNGEIITPASVHLDLIQQVPGGKKRVVQSRPINPDANKWNEAPALDRYPNLVAIDTNSREIHGRVVNVTSAIVFNFPIRDGLRYVTFKPLPRLEFHGATLPPERIGWHYYLNILNQQKPRGLVAIVTDHDVKSHEQINKRREEIVCGYKLPEGFEIVYASSERRQAQLTVNKMVKLCDMASNEVFEQIEKIPSIETTHWAQPQHNNPPFISWCHRWPPQLTYRRDNILSISDTSIIADS